MKGASLPDWGKIVGVYRLNPAAGIFAVTVLPLCSLSVLDKAACTRQWLADLGNLAGTREEVPVKEVAPLRPDHYGMLVFLCSVKKADRTSAMFALEESSIFSWPQPVAHKLMDELSARGLIEDAMCTEAALDLVCQSPYAAYLSAMNEVTHD